MKKRKLTLLIIFIGIFLGFAFYFLLALYYREGFSLNTWINGIYCTGKSVEEVNSELLLQTKAPIIQVTDRYGNTYSIDLGNARYQEDYLPALNRYMDEQDPFLWVDNITLHKSHNLQPDVSYDKDALKQIFYELEPIAKERQRYSEFSLSRNEKDGWILYDGMSNRLDAEGAFEAVVEKIAEGELEIYLEELDCYYNIPLTKEQERIKELFEKADAFQKWDVVYDMGTEEFSWSAGEMAYFFQVDEAELPKLDKEGQLILDEEAVKAAVVEFAEIYDTYGKEHKFQSTRGEEIIISGGTYGNKLNQKKELTFLLNNLLKEENRIGEKQYHVPEYERQAWVRGRDDIGTTYVEVDMTQQKLYYYEEGELVIETDIVTGDMAKKRYTPEGVNFVYGKERNRILRGRDYADFVKYWMPVNGNIGLHDAEWRSEFGGTIYLKDGSHGCVNMPDDAVAELYGRVEIGMPVVMFY